MTDLDLQQALGAALAILLVCALIGPIIQRRG